MGDFAQLFACINDSKRQNTFGTTVFGAYSLFWFGVAAYSELLVSLFSFYGCAATVLNPHFGREFIPVGKPFGIFKK